MNGPLVAVTAVVDVVNIVVVAAAAIIFAVALVIVAVAASSFENNLQLPPQIEQISSKSRGCVCIN